MCIDSFDDLKYSYVHVNSVKGQGQLHSSKTGLKNIYREEKLKLTHDQTILFKVLVHQYNIKKLNVWFIFDIFILEPLVN